MADWFTVLNGCRINLLWFDCRIVFTESAVYQLVCCVIRTFEWTQNMWAFFNEYPFVYFCEIKRFIKMIDFICLIIFNHFPTVIDIYFKQNIMLFKQFLKNLFVRYFPIVYFRPCQTDVRWEISYHPFTYHNLHKTIILHSIFFRHRFSSFCTCKFYSITDPCFFFSTKYRNFLSQKTCWICCGILLYAYIIRSILMVYCFR